MHAILLYFMSIVYVNLPRLHAHNTHTQTIFKDVKNWTLPRVQFFSMRVPHKIC